MKQDTQPRLLMSFMDGVAKAAGAASAMCHAHADPRFLPIRDRLEAVHKASSKIAVKASGLQVAND